MKSFVKFATRLDNLVLVLCICLFTGIIAHGENGPTPQVVVGSSGISDGSITPAKISSGYNLLTTAEKTQALTGSSTVDFAANDGNFEGFVKIGSDSTPIQMKVLTGTTASAEGGFTTVAHGLTGEKIVDIHGICRTATNEGVTAEHMGSAGYQFSIQYSSTLVYVINNAANSENILSKPFSVIIWYQE